MPKEYPKDLYCVTVKGKPFIVTPPLRFGDPGQIAVVRAIVKERERLENEKPFHVRLTFRGSYDVDVDALDADDAIDKAKEQFEINDADVSWCSTEADEIKKTF